MNHQLRELMLEAGFAAPEMAGRAQKLAELIVWECVSIVREAVDYRDPASTYADKLAKHFGLDE
jgi:hypothetical protein